MSLDVYLYGPEYEAWCRCDQCGHEHTRINRDELYTANITHNLTKMARAVGVYLPLWHPGDIGITKASQLVGTLEAGLNVMQSDRERIEQFNPPNGWGDYDGFLRFVREYLGACKEHPEATVEAWG